MDQPIRVLIVDDSPLFVEALSLALEEDSGLRVVGTAPDGRAAVARVRQLEPDIVAMDVHMPVMDGFEAVEEIMSTRPTPILLLTGDPRREETRLSFEAMNRGALDLIGKPSLRDDKELDALREHLKLLASVPVVYRRRRSGRDSVLAARFEATPAGRSGLVGIVSSTGGPPVLAEIFESLPADIPLAFVVVQHLASGFAPQLVSWLDGSSRLSVRLAQHGAEARPGTVHVVPSGCHGVVNGAGILRMDTHSPPVDGHRPSGTLLLRSIARGWGPRGSGVVLSGMGSDGVEGLLELRSRRGRCIAQDGETSAVDGMPRVARDSGAAELVLPRWEIARALCEFARGLTATV